jgi:hypothetical protein
VGVHCARLRERIEHAEDSVECVFLVTKMSRAVPLNKMAEMIRGRISHESGTEDGIIKIFTQSSWRVFEDDLCVARKNDFPLHEEETSSREGAFL